MIKIKSITVKNFMSIGSISLTFPDGITELIGQNLDANGSNGTGKSSLLLAIPQCLFNKNPEVGLKNVNNDITGKPYQIILDIETDDGQYTIDNNRDNNKIIIKHNGEIVTTRIKESLSYIEEYILKLSYHEFITLAFITSDSLKSIFDITSANLLLKLFSLNKLDEYTEALKMERRTLSRELTQTRKTIVPTESLKDILESIDELHKEINDKELEVQDLQIAKDSLNTERLAELQSKKVMNKTGICPTCNQVVAEEDVDEEELTRLINSNNEVSTQYSNASNQLRKLQTQLRLLDARRIALLEIKQQAQKINNTNNVEIRNQVEVINHTLKVIQQGAVHQVYLNQFLRVLNKNLIENVKSNFSINAKLNNSSIVYDIKTDGTSKIVEQLSGGEATVAALVVLTALYKTLTQLLGIDINLLILDEAIHKVDEESKEFISDLIKYMNKQTIVVQHANNINPNIFTDSVTIVKQKGIAHLGEMKCM